ncbi:MAG: DUF115 domain-containing protein [Labilithrix sp.]|nr:DUF115 domain-containing protein [Labilithrix sp.]MCW5814740.1 DUF115 domain-containing protein [Labilithrix sp.]
MTAESSDADGGLGRKIVAELGALTWHRVGPTSVANAKDNFEHRARGRSLAALRRSSLGEGDSAVIVGAGPSIRRHDPARYLKDYRGTIICTDSAIRYLLKNGIVPHLVVTVDSHATRIVRWFGDPELTEETLRKDDYFRRQDMDDAFAAELETNREVLALLAEHAPKMKIALSTSASKAVVRRVVDCGMDVYWWNPMLDDPDAPESATREIFEMNGFPCINGGGNVGTCCWMMATEVLEKKRVALTGMDFAYYEDTPYEATQYYREAVDLVGKENLGSIFMRLRNPDLGAWFYTDPAYMWYRECFLQMVAESDAKTINCTGGGIIFGDGITTMPLEAFVAELS